MRRAQRALARGLAVILFFPAILAAGQDDDLCPLPPIIEDWTSQQFTQNPPAPAQLDFQPAPQSQFTPQQTSTGQQPSGQRLATTAADVPFSERNFQDDLLVLPVDHLLGDWWGLRTRLEDQGITPSLTFEFLQKVTDAPLHPATIRGEIE